MNRPSVPNRKRLIGVLHLLPLPGSPNWSGSMGTVRERARADALAYQEGGVDGVILENYGDVPFTSGRVPAETVAAMAAVGQSLLNDLKVPLGFNVLRNDPAAALALCASCGGGFIRVNVHTGVMVADQGVIEGRAFDTLRQRRTLGLATEIWADVHVKHAVPLGGGDLAEAARDAVERGLADALIVSGVGTGRPAEVGDVAAVREACPLVPIYLGSGLSAGNAGFLLKHADGALVGTSLKRDGKVGEAVDVERVRALRAAMDAI